MGSSGTTAFTMDVNQIIEKAYELVGGELESGEDLRQARISLQLLLIDLQNRGHPLGKLENVVVSCSSSVNTYALTSTVVDVLDMVLVRSSVATPMERISLFDYHKLPKKTLNGRPVQWATDRTKGYVNLFIYLTPDNNTDLLDFWCVKKIEDAGAYTNNIDLSDRFLPAIIFGLAYFLALEKKDFSPGPYGNSPLASKRAELKQLYIESLTAAFQEDDERVSYNVVPPGYFRRGR